MQRDEAIQLVTAILSRHCGLPADSISADMHVQEDLGLDSIDAAELIVTLQERTGRQLDFERLEDIDTVGKIVDCLVAVTASEAEAVPA